MIISPRSISGLKFENGGIDAEAAFRQQQIAKHDAGTLEAVGDVEDFRDEGEAVANIKRSGDDPGIIAKGGAQHLPEIALLGLGGNSGGRARTLAVNHHDGNFGLGGEAQGLRS